MKNILKGISYFLLYAIIIIFYILVVEFTEKNILNLKSISLTKDILAKLIGIFITTIIFLIFLSISAIKCIKLNNRKVIIYVLPIILILLANVVFWIYNAI